MTIDARVRAVLVAELGKPDELMASDALLTVERAQATFTIGGDPGSVIEIPKIELADAVLAAVAAARRRAARIKMLPKPSPAPVVEVTTRPKRRMPA